MARYTQPMTNEQKKKLAIAWIEDCKLEVESISSNANGVVITVVPSQEAKAEWIKHFGEPSKIAKKPCNCGKKTTKGNKGETDVVQ